MTNINTGKEKSICNCLFAYKCLKWLIHILKHNTYFFTHTITRYKRPRTTTLTYRYSTFLLSPLTATMIHLPNLDEKLCCIHSTELSSNKGIIKLSYGSSKVNFPFRNQLCIGKEKSPVGFISTYLPVFYPDRSF